MTELLAAIAENIGTVHIVLFVLGIIFLIAEMFEPGFGVCGGIGVVLMLIDVFILADNFAQGMVLIAGVVLLLLLFVLIMFILASYGILPKKLVLADAGADAGDDCVSTDVAPGDTGIAVTLLRPSGKAELGGVVRDVISDGEFIDKGAEITVLTVTRKKIVVKKIKPDTGIY